MSQYIDIKIILSSVAVFIILVILSIGTLGIPRLLNIKSEPINPPINVSSPDKETIEEAKKKGDVIKYDHKVEILDKPIFTPAFVTDPNKLKDYLGKVSTTIIITGKIKNAYVYIKSGEIDIQKESIYFYIVDGRTVDGHLFPPEALQSINNNAFIYDLGNLPLVKFPYSLNGQVVYENVIEKIFNYPTTYNNGRYYIGAFVSTTKLPNQITSIEIRFTCEQGGTLCDIKKE